MKDKMMRPLSTILCFLCFATLFIFSILAYKKHEHDKFFPVAPDLSHPWSENNYQRGEIGCDDQRFTIKGITIDSKNDHYTLIGDNFICAEEDRLTRASKANESPTVITVGQNDIGLQIRNGSTDQLKSVYLNSIP